MPAGSAPKLISGHLLKPLGRGDFLAALRPLGLALACLQRYAAVPGARASGHLAKEQGYVTYEEINAVLSQEQVSSERIEDVMTMLSETGINLIDGEESEDNKEGGARNSEKAVVEKEANEQYGRTDDPVRMYLREMGSVELLSREGEIAIAKRIEAGRETMINGICQSPLTISAIIEWRDMLVNGEVLLREIIDLGATYVGNSEGNGADKSEAQNADAKALKAEAEKPGDEDEEDDDEEEEKKGNVSLAAMEMALKPIVLETCDLIAKTYKRFREVQDARMQAAMKHQELTPQQEKRYQKLRGELVALVQSVHLHNNRMEALIDQLYGITAASSRWRAGSCAWPTGTACRASSS